jgi:hypothetical protein
MQRRTPTSEAAALDLLGLAGSRSSPKIRVKSSVSTKKNAEAAGKVGKYMGKTANNMFIIQVDGKAYNFFKKDLENPEVVTGHKSPPKHNGPKTLSPGSSMAEKIANDFINRLDAGIADKVISAICKRRTSRTKKSPTTGRKSPSKRKSPTRKACKGDEEISAKTKRCVKKCNPDQYRDPDTNRCRKRTSTKKSEPKIISRMQSPSKNPFEDTPRATQGNPFDDSDNDYTQLEPRVRMTRERSPKYIQMDNEPVDEFITEEVTEGPFINNDDDDIIA